MCCVFLFGDARMRMRIRDVQTMPGLEGRGGEGGGGRERGGGERGSLLVIFFFLFFSVGLRIDDVVVFADEGKRYPRTKSFDRYNKLENSYGCKAI